MKKNLASAFLTVSIIALPTAAAKPADKLEVSGGAIVAMCIQSRFPTEYIKLFKSGTATNAQWYETNATGWNLAGIMAATSASFSNGKISVEFLTEKAKADEQKAILGYLKPVYEAAANQCAQQLGVTLGTADLEYVVVNKAGKRVMSLSSGKYAMEE